MFVEKSRENTSVFLCLATYCTYLTSISGENYKQFRNAFETLSLDFFCFLWLIDILGMVPLAYLAGSST